MGFMSGAFDKSVFDKSSYKAAIGNTDSTDTNGYACIKILPDFPRTNGQYDMPVIGVTQKKGLSFSITSEWRDIGAIAGAVFPKTAGGVMAGLIGRANDISQVAGNMDMGAVAASRKIYQKSGYLTISPEMRVVDWKGNGQPVMSALMLAGFASPHSQAVMTSEDLKEALAQSYEDIKNAIDQAKNAEKNGTSFSAKIAGVVLEVTEGVVAAGADLMENADQIIMKGPLGNMWAKTKSELESIEKDLSLRSSPVPVTVYIGNFFKRADMIIQSVSFDFSREMTANGPLYVDINLSLSSRTILTSELDMGIIIPGKSDRVDFVNSTGI